MIIDKPDYLRKRSWIFRPMALPLEWTDPIHMKSYNVDDAYELALHRETHPFDEAPAKRERTSR